MSTAGYLPRTVAFVSLLGLLPATALLAQTPVRGTALDARQQPLPGATVRLFAPADSAHAQGTVTSPDGSFALTAAPGHYVLRLTMVGYQPQRRLLTIGAAPVQVPGLTLTEARTQLQAVTVQAERPVLQDGLDKKVIDVAKDLNSAGGTAADALRHVPAVTVADGGAVTLRGQAATVLIDGKNTSLRLDQIPAATIAQIEVLTNPGAGYDAQGAGGVINLISKKEQRPGWNHNGTLLAGTGHKYNLSVGGNRRAGRLNVALQYTGFNSRFGQTSQQTLHERAAGTTLHQTSQGRQHNQLNNVQLNVDYTLSPTQELSLTVVPYLNRFARTTDQTDEFREATAPLAQRLTARNRYAEDGQVLQASLDYRRRWAAQPGRSLQTSLSYYGGPGSVLTAQDVTGGLPQPLQLESQLQLHLRNVAGQLGYTQPLSKQAVLEAGLKSQYQAIGTVLGFRQRLGTEQAWQPQPGRSLRGKYHEAVQAAYATLRYQGSAWRTEAGLRTEYTRVWASTTGATGGALGRQYLNVFPSASVGRRLSPAQQLQLSYRRRLDRPAFQQLLPTPFFTDLRSYTTGNPALQPQYLDRLELGHELTYRTTALTTALYAQHLSQAQQPFQQLDSAATRLNEQLGLRGPVVGTTTRNLGSVRSYGLELSLTQTLAPWWRLTASGALLRQQVRAAGFTPRPLTTGTLRLLSSFTPTATLDVQLAATYRAAQLTPQTRQAAVGFLDLALRQQVLHQRGAIIVRVSDLLNTRRSRAATTTPELLATSRQQRESRIGYLGFSWYIGASKAPKRIEQAQDNN